MAHLQTLVVPADVDVLYSLASVRFSKAVQPLRMKVIDDIESLCRDDNIPEEVKDDLRNLCDSLFSKLNGWLIVTLFPYAVVKSWFRGSKPSVMQEMSRRDRSKVTQTIGTGMFCVIAISPLCTVIFGIEFIVSLILAAPWAWVRNLMRVVTSVDERFGLLPRAAKP